MPEAQKITEPEEGSRVRGENNGKENSLDLIKTLP